LCEEDHKLEETNGKFIMLPLSVSGLAALPSTHPPAGKRGAALERQAARQPDGLAGLKQRIRAVRALAM
jgi:Zn-dependent protease with chaperone function